jgi:hypothetical protein
MAQLLINCNKNIHDSEVCNMCTRPLYTVMEAFKNYPNDCFKLNVHKPEPSKIEYLVRYTYLFLIRNSNCLLACLQLTSPSAQRRILVAEMITALLAPAAVQPLTAPGLGDSVLSGYGLGHAPLIDCTAQASVLLPALHRLAEVRMEQVLIVGFAHQFP